MGTMITGGLVMERNDIRMVTRVKLKAMRMGTGMEIR